jgi:hypothetical protein
MGPERILLAFRSMQTRPFEKAVALARLDAQVHGLAVAVDGERHVDAGLALRPDAAEKAGEIAYLLAGNLEHDVAAGQEFLAGMPAREERQAQTRTRRDVALSDISGGIGITV